MSVVQPAEEADAPQLQTNLASEPLDVKVDKRANRQTTRIDSRTNPQFLINNDGEESENLKNNAPIPNRNKAPTGDLSVGSYEKTQHVLMKGDLEEASRLESPLPPGHTRPQSQKIEGRNPFLQSPSSSQMNAEETLLAQKQKEQEAVK